MDLEILLPLSKPHVDFVFFVFYSVFSFIEDFLQFP